MHPRVSSFLRRGAGPLMLCHRLGARSAGPSPSSALLLNFLLLQASPRAASAFHCAPSIIVASKRLNHLPANCYRPHPQHQRDFSHLPTTALMSTSASQPTASTSGILGGDYAGLSATFSSKTGELVHVPEHLVPASMLEWGDIPTSLETLSSEDWSAESDTFERTTITVLPEVGCGIDNLEVTKTTDTYNRDASRWSNWGEQQPDRAKVAIDRERGQTLDMETIFQADPEVDEDGKSYARRVRVSFSVDVPQESGEPTLSKLITLHVERQTLTKSSRGTAWSGPSSNSGGLDARTVMNTIGKDIVYGDVFSVKRLKAGGKLWDFDGMIHGENGDFHVSDDTPVTIRLPQNIMVRYGALTENTSWGIEVTHFEDMRDEKDVLHRRVVMRSLQTSGFDRNGDQSNLGDIDCWTKATKQGNTAQK